MTGFARGAVLQVRDLEFAYAHQPALVRRWTTVIGPGVTLLHGDSGTGKSTLLRLMAGVLPAHGDLVLDGARLKQDAQAYRRRVFFGHPIPDEWEQLSARECTARLGEGDPGFDPARWQELADGFALGPHLDKPLYMLSTGTKRKVWLAAALACGRALTLLDEPAGALDLASVRVLWGALQRAAGSEHRAIVVASAEHIPQVPWAATIELPLA